MYAHSKKKLRNSPRIPEVYNSIKFYVHSSAIERELHWSVDNRKWEDVNCSKNRIYC